MLQTVRAVCLVIVGLLQLCAVVALMYIASASAARGELASPAASDLIHTVGVWCILIWTLCLPVSGCALFAQNPLARILNLAMVVLYVIGAWLLQGAITVHPRELGTPLQDDVAWYVFGCTPWFSLFVPFLFPWPAKWAPFWRC